MSNKILPNRYRCAHIFCPYDKYTLAVEVKLKSKALSFKTFWLCPDHAILLIKEYQDKTPDEGVSE